MIMDSYDSIPQKPEEKYSMKIFTLLIALIELLGITCVVLVAVWRGHFHGGFGFAIQTEFNFHPLFMTLGMIFLYANGILVYRVFRDSKKIYIKILHGSIHILVLLFSSIGLKCVFDSHNYDPNGPRPNMYTLHSWLGILTVSLFALQWLIGFCSFLLPCCSHRLRALVKPFHIYFGCIIFILAASTALLGTTEKALWELGGNYEKLEGEGILVNVFGLIIVIFVTIVMYVVSKGDYKRRTSPEEETVNLTN